MTDVRPAPRRVLTVGGQPFSQFTITAQRALLTNLRPQVQLPRDQSLAVSDAAVSTRWRGSQPNTAARDPLWNGMAIGAAIGAGSILVVGVHCASAAQNCSRPGGAAFAGVVALWAGIGAGIGALVDFLR